VPIATKGALRGRFGPSSRVRVSSTELIRCRAKSKRVDRKSGCFDLPQAKRDHDDGKSPSDYDRVERLYGQMFFPTPVFYCPGSRSRQARRTSALSDSFRWSCPKGNCEPLEVSSAPTPGPSKSMTDAILSQRARAAGSCWFRRSQDPGRARTRSPDPQLRWSPEKRE
jgi:hypothetical protein